MSDNGNKQRKQEILHAAARVFDERGFAAATMDAVAAEAGISKGSIYNYFPSKDDLFYEVVTDAFAVEHAEAEAFLEAPGSAKEKLLALLDRWYEKFANHQVLGRVLLEFWATAAREQRQGRVTQMLQESYQRWRRQLSETIRRGIETGEFCPQSSPDNGSALYMAVLDGLLLHSVLGTGLELTPELLAAVKRQVSAGVTNEPVFAESPGADAEARSEAETPQGDPYEEYADD